MCALRIQILHFRFQPRGIILEKGKIYQGSLALDFPVGPIPMGSNGAKIDQ
jgi:hypothetical protein